MPTKRMFDLVILTVFLAQPVRGLFKMAAARMTTDTDSTAKQLVGGALTIAS